MSDLAPERCRTCSAPRRGPFCADCGQRHLSGRLTLRAILRDAAETLFNLDRGLLHTLVEGVRRPGQMAREYVGGRTVPYSQPLRVLLIGVAVAQLASLQFGIVESFLGGLFEGREDVSRSAATEFVFDWFAAIAVLYVPLFALATRLAFRSRGFNYAENLVLHCYAFGVSALGFAFGFTPLDALDLPGPKAVTAVVGAAFFLSLFLHYANAVRGFFRSGWLAAISVTFALAALGVTALISMLFLAA